MLKYLIFDVKKLIASHSEEVWYHMYRYDDRFRIYASSNVGGREFIRLFLKKDMWGNVTEYRLFGKLNSVYGQPARIYSTGTVTWYRNGYRHRDNDQPAITYSNGSKYWYQNGKLHRDNENPAVIMSNGTEEWYRNGYRHRDNDLPAIIDIDGTKEWYRNGY